MSAVIPFRLRPRLLLTCFLTLTLAVGCGGGEAAEEAEPQADAAAEAEPAGGEAAEASVPPAQDQSATTAAVTTEDIDRWEKGMAGEMEAVRAAAEKMKSAKTNEDTLSAMMGVQENATWEPGAKAAGMDVERYKFVRSELSAAASYLTPHLGGIDTTMLSPAQRAEMRQMNEAQLKQMEERVPAEVVEALRPRAAELRKQSMELVAARLKGAGMTQ